MRLSSERIAEMIKIAEQAIAEGRVQDDDFDLTFTAPAVLELLTCFATEREQCAKIADGVAAKEYRHAQETADENTTANESIRASFASAAARDIAAAIRRGGA